MERVLQLKVSSDLPHLQPGQEEAPRQLPQREGTTFATPTSEIRGPVDAAGPTSTRATTATTQPSSPPSRSEAAFRRVHALEEQVKTDGACTLPGVSIAYDLFMPIMMRAVARGYVK